jgi:glycerol-3-phosphate dehydrogenase
MDVGQLEHLLHRHGDTVDQVLDLARSAPALAGALPGEQGYLRAEAVYAVTHEGACHLDDVLTRRTRLSIEVRDRGLRAAPVVAELVAPYLGWTQTDVDRELRQYRAAVAAGLDAEGEPDDQSAEAARRRALEVPLSA